MSKSALRFWFKSSNHEVRQLFLIFSGKTTFMFNFEYFKIIETEKKFNFEFLIKFYIVKHLVVFDYIKFLKSTHLTVQCAA